MVRKEVVQGRSRIYTSTVDVGASSPGIHSNTSQDPNYAQPRLMTVDDQRILIHIRIQDTGRVSGNRSMVGDSESSPAMTSSALKSADDAFPA